MIKRSQGFSKVEKTKESLIERGFNLAQDSHVALKDDQ
jgi:hypothetical protein